MKKTNYFVTKEATKYWKKAIKDSRLRIARDGESLFIVNDYNAFVIPAIESVYNDLVLPAVGVPMPESGVALCWDRGKHFVGMATDTVSMIEKMIASASYDVKTTPFAVSVPGGNCAIYKTPFGLMAINDWYHSFVDHKKAVSYKSAGAIHPLIISGGPGFTAILLPVRCNNLRGRIEDLLRF